MIRLERRRAPSQAWSWATPVLAVALTMVAGGIMFALLGKDPLVAIRTIFWDPIFGEFASYYRGQLLIKAAPLVLIAIGLAFGFRAGVWNIGAEGQFIVGAITAAAVGLAFYPFESRWIFVAMIFAGAFGGFVWGMIPALLRAKFGTSETLVSLMLVYVAEKLVASAALSFLRNPEGMGMPGSRVLARYVSTANLDLIPNTGFHWGVVAAIVAVIVGYVAHAKHMFGFNTRLAGESPRAAAFSGVNPSRLLIACLGLSGALAGLAGMFEVAGPAGRITIDFGPGYGFTAIIVAFLGRLNPIGILLAGLLMALTYVGGSAAQTAIGLPASAIQAFQGMLLFFLLAVDVLTNYRLKSAKGA